MDRGGRTITACYIDAYGEEAVPDADPYSAIALSELQWLIRSARLARGQIVVDLGCGRGGPGRVLARSTSVRLIGLDFSIVGVTSAATSAAGMHPRPAYIACDARAIPLADHSVDAVISIDVLQLIPERELVLREVARVLQPGGFIAFSSWELIADDEGVPPRLRRLPRDYTAVATTAGLRVRDLQVPTGARERDEAFWANVTASADELRRELGEETATSVLGEASLSNIFAESTRRVLCVAQS
jgi:SAM-dependent methyltransferase